MEWDPRKCIPCTPPPPSIFFNAPSYTAVAFNQAEQEEAAKEKAEGRKFKRGASAFHKMIEDADGFAQVFPETKFEIVRRLQLEKHNVGMTGDGVNDAPALKVANVGIAVAGATDAARAGILT